MNLFSLCHGANKVECEEVRNAVKLHTYKQYKYINFCVQYQYKTIFHMIKIQIQ